MRQRILTLGQWSGLGLLAGLLCGSASALFLYLLERATAAHVADERLLLLLPLAGFLMGLAYQRWGRELLPGSNLVLDRLHSGGPQLPWRMAPMALLGTVWSHLFGASVGREGTGVQMGASLADGAAHALKLGPAARRHLLAAGVAGGFGSVFGTPLAGTLFGMEVVAAGSLDYSAIVPCLVAGLVGDWVTRAWGIQHAVLPTLEALPLSLDLLLRWALFAAAVALLAWAFITLTHKLKDASQRYAPSLPLRLALGGVLSVALWQVLGTADYLGLSTPLISVALSGGPLPAWAFLAKLAFTVLALGTGFIGGEVTPLFVIGACLGHALAGPLGLPVGLAAGVGLASLFAAAANTPLAMTVMAVELMGAAVLPHVALVAVLAWLLSGKVSIYASQKHAFHAEAPRPAPTKGRRRGKA
jgi:H+/Cl- antiporter ClcA